MSGTSTSDATSADSGQRWAAFDSRNERLATAAELRLLGPDRDHADADRSLKAAS